MNRYVDSTQEEVTRGSSRIECPNLARFIRDRIEVLQEEFKEQGRPGFSGRAVKELEVVCDFVSKNGIKAMPAIFEGDDGCPNIVYANGDLSRRLSVDISACGKVIEIWLTDDEDSRLFVRGGFDANRLQDALFWLSPPEGRRRIAPSLAA